MKRWTAKSLLPMPVSEGDSVKRIYFRVEYCDGCRACETVCRERHSGSRVLFMDREEEPVSSARITVERQGGTYWAVVCQHCAEAPCVGACMTGAMQYGDEGEVIHRVDRCVGCWMCVMVCPFGAVLPQPEERKVAKCDCCAGERRPACVAACSRQALWYGSPEEFEEKTAGDGHALSHYR